MKFLIWFAIVFVLINWVSRQKKASRSAHFGPRPASQPQHAIAAEPMLPCRDCGLHVPASEAVMHASGVVFCCDEHRRRIFPS